MTDQQNNRWRGWSIGCSACVAALVLYVLSSGPVFYCLYRWNAPQRFHTTMQAFYYPMILIPLVNVPASEYCSWWTGQGISHRPKPTVGTTPP